MPSFLEEPHEGEAYIGTLRAGPDAMEWGKPFTCAANLFIRLRDGRVIVKALIGSEFKREYLESTHRLALAITGKKAIYIRIKGEHHG